MNKIIADSGELNRIMKVLSRCMDKRMSIHSNIQILHENDKLTIRAANGTFLGEMSMKVPGGDGETFCVDGDMFARVVGMCNKNIEILTDGKNCALKGIGRTRIPIVNAKVKAPDEIKGECVLLFSIPPKAAEAPTAQELDTLLRQLMDHMTLKDAAREAAETLKLPKKQVYARALELKK